MNEVETFAQAGKRAGAALGSGVQTARKARDATQAALAQRWGVTQDALAERLYEARHELAARIEPEPSHRRRWSWLILTFVVIAGAVGAAILARRPQEIEPDPRQLRPVREPGARDSDPAVGGDPEAAAGSPTSNGMVGVEHPSAGTD